MTLINRARYAWRRSVIAALVVAMALAMVGVEGGSASAAVRHHRSSGHSSHSNIVFGQLLPFTGTKAFLSSWATHGDAAAVHDVNRHGGVMGHKLVATSADDGGDAVDAVPALRKLLISHPAFIVGPFSLAVEAVINDFDPNHVVDYVIGGTTQLDHMRKRYVFRTTASDSAEVVAMAYYAAIHKHLKRAAFIFDNSANTQGLVAPLRAAYRKLGGRVVANETIVPDQASYLSEVTQAFSHHPDVVFCAFDEQTATTVWTAARELGDLNVKWVGEDVLGSPGYGAAFGQPAASKYLETVSGAPPGGRAYEHFLSDYQAVYHTRQILTASYNMFDSVIISALAMTAAHSTNPRVWVRYVERVSNPPGVKCYTYEGCVRFLRSHKEINYQGATGPEDFNRYHNTFNGFAVSGFNLKNQLVEHYYVTAYQVAHSA
ncbi:MAG: ABC transporter substrate-binding protein [Acidimicrobiales bacterium]